MRSYGSAEDAERAHTAELWLLWACASRPGQAGVVLAPWPSGRRVCLCLSQPFSPEAGRGHICLSSDSAPSPKPERRGMAESSSKNACVLEPDVRDGLQRRELK